MVKEGLEVEKLPFRGSSGKATQAMKQMFSLVVFLFIEGKNSDASRSQVSCPRLKPVSMMLLSFGDIVEEGDLGQGLKVV